MRRALDRPGTWLGTWHRWAARARVAAASAGRVLADRATVLAYRRAELGALVLLAASLIGGLAIDRWRTRQPVLVDWLEAEPPRLGARRPATARGPDRIAAPDQPLDPRAGPALDLNRATAGDLARLPGIGPRLAARIVAARTARGGRFDSPADLAAIPGVGRRRAGAVEALVMTTEHAAPAAPGEPP